MSRLSATLLALRAVGVAALLLLLVDPATPRAGGAGAPPLVLLDASLSMATPAVWRAALDSARAAARPGGVIWRFGDRVTAFDTTAPADGATRLAPALDAAAARGGPVTIVTDGAVDDAADLPPDLRQRARVILVARPQPSDAFVASVSGPRHLTPADTATLEVTVGSAGPRQGTGGKRASVVAAIAGKRLAAAPVTLPDSGTISTSLLIPASRFPAAGWNAVAVRLEGVADAEPRDDARLFVTEVSPQPLVVVLASPPDWESRFLAPALRDVTRVPVRLYVETEHGRWRDGATLAPVATTAVTRAAAGARVLVLLGDPARSRALLGGGGSRGAATLTWNDQTGRDGDWYVTPPPASALAGRLAGIAWDSLPPLAAVADPPPGVDSGIVPVLTAQLARRGPGRPVAVLQPGDGAPPRATVLASGLWRWAFRGGASEQAYRGLVAALADYLLGEGARRGGGGAAVVPVTLETANGLPLLWRWTGSDAPPAAGVALTLDDGGRARADTLRFDAGGRAELRLPPGVYRYSARVGAATDRGVVAVEEYSAEWRPRPPALSAQPGQPFTRRDAAGLRDRLWLFALAVAAFTAEWAWRRRHGLP